MSGRDASGRDAEERRQELDSRHWSIGEASAKRGGRLTDQERNEVHRGLASGVQRARRVVTAVHGTWGSFWRGVRLLNFPVSTGSLVSPTPKWLDPRVRLLVYRSGRDRVAAGLPGPDPWPEVSRVVPAGGRQDRRCPLSANLVGSRHSFRPGWRRVSGGASLASPQHTCISFLGRACPARQRCSEQQRQNWRSIEPGVQRPVRQQVASSLPSSTARRWPEQPLPRWLIACSQLAQRR